MRAPVLFTPVLVVVHASWLMLHVTTAMATNARVEETVSSYWRQP